jgi:tetratricopeptide (TPR) repeat protein
VALGARIMEGLHRYGMRRHHCGDLLQAAIALLETGQADEATAARLHRFSGAFAPALGLLALAREHIETACDYYRRAREDRLLCDALGSLAVICFETGRYDECENLLLEIREQAERLGDERMVYATLGRLGALHLAQRGFPSATAYLMQAVDGLRKVDERRQLAIALKNLAVAAHYGGDHLQAVRYAEEAIALASAGADATLRPLLLCVQGNAYSELGRAETALEKHAAACGLLPKLGACVELAECLEDVATTFASHGRHDAAARIVGYSDALRRRIGSEMNPGLRDFYDRTVGQLQAALGPHFTELRSAGERESLESLVQLIEESAEGASRAVTNRS